MKKVANILQYVIIFLLVYLTINFFLGPGEDTNPTGADFEVSIKKELSQHELVTVQVKNHTEFEAVIENECPDEPLTVSKKVNGEWTIIESTRENGCEETSDTVIPAGEEATINYSGWNHALFGELGTYKVAADIKVPDNPDKAKIFESNEFEVKEQGWFSFLWTAGFYQPIFNALIYITSLLPAHDLGWAIIILTIIIRTILLIPSHRAMKSQRKIQELQPKLNKIKHKYKDNQEALARETMMLWKENKVNPVSSCLPLLIQFPFLIAIFYVIQSGLNPDNIHLLYGPLKDFALNSINTNFLGILELTEVNMYVLPLIVGGLQFAQMKLAMMRTRKKESRDMAEKSEKKKGAEMEMANRVMVYFMPVMIALFTASVPAGVGLYWSTSTLYGIAQQFVVNRQVEDETSSVRVIKK